MASQLQTTSYEIHTAPEGYLNEGSVWVVDTEHKHKLLGLRRIVRITHPTPAGNKTVYCPALYAEPSEVATFPGFEGNQDNQRDHVIWVSAWYRQLLGLTPHDLRKKIDLNMSLDTRFLWLLYACVQHPQIVI
jgi:hypothetical protein